MEERLIDVRNDRVSCSGGNTRGPSLRFLSFLRFGDVTQDPVDSIHRHFEEKNVLKRVFVYPKSLFLTLVFVACGVGLDASMNVVYKRQSTKYYCRVWGLTSSLTDHHS